MEALNILEVNSRKTKNRCLLRISIFGFILHKLIISICSRPAHLAWHIPGMKGLVLCFEVHSMIIADFSFETTAFCVKFETVRVSDIGERRTGHTNQKGSDSQGFFQCFHCYSLQKIHRNRIYFLSD